MQDKLQTSSRMVEKPFLVVVQIQMLERGNPADWCLHPTCQFEVQLQDFSSYHRGLTSNYGIEKRSILEETSAVSGLLEGAWVVCADFNITRYASERELFQKN